MAYIFITNIHNLCFEQKFSIYLNRRVFVMFWTVSKAVSKVYMSSEHMCTMKVKIRPQSYNTFFMLNSAEHELFSANKYKNNKQ